MDPSRTRWTISPELTILVPTYQVLRCAAAWPGEPLCLVQHMWPDAWILASSLLELSFTQQQGSHPTGAGPGEASEDGSFAAAQPGQSSPKLLQQALAEHVYLLASAHEVFRSQAGSHACVKLQSLSQSCHDACKPQLFCGLRGLHGAWHSCSDRDIAHAPSHLNKARSPACQRPRELTNSSPSNMDGFVLGQVIGQVA